MEVAGSVFVYMSALLEADVPAFEKATSISESYAVLYHVCLFEVDRIVAYYRDSHMETDDPSPFSPFVLMYSSLTQPEINGVHPDRPVLDDLLHLQLPQPTHPNSQLQRPGGHPPQQRSGHLSLSNSKD
jgi:hypothetical protein